MTYIEKYMAEHPQEHDGSVMMWDCPIKHFDGFKRPDACEHNDTPFEICKRCWHGEYVEEKSEEDKPMTYFQKYVIEHPGIFVDVGEDAIINNLCPSVEFGDDKYVDCPFENDESMCTACWNRPYVEETSKKESESKKTIELGNCIAEGIEDGMNNPSPLAVAMIKKLKETLPSDIPVILDSGNRREFETGAVRDIQEGKGRCDLMPLDVVSEYRGRVLESIAKFQEDGNIIWLESALQRFIDKHYNKDMSTAFLECAKHFEEGAKKYGENNWQKGIPTHCYIDSAVRHYLKFLRGDKDEPHDRAFVWNILCCIWTCKHKPELNDYAKKEA